jgi:hypothetical protein
MVERLTVVFFFFVCFFVGGGRTLFTWGDFKGIGGGGAYYMLAGGWGKSGLTILK